MTAIQPIIWAVILEQNRLWLGAPENMSEELLSPIYVTTLMASQSSDTVTPIFKCNSSNTIKSLRLLKMA